MSPIRKQIFIRGIVQGVGFRPFVWHLAKELNCTGTVCNDTCGVRLEVQGADSSVEEFSKRLIREAPSLARITEWQSNLVDAHVDESAFVILQSDLSDSPIASVSPDVSICEDCMKEMHEPHDRRYGYPFINCTHCGPRFTIVQSLPYDRQRTTMRRFKLCEACQSEYDSPADRRFHAEPNACLDCGPRIWFADSSSPEYVLEPPMRSSTDLERTRTQMCVELVQSKIAQGAVIAMKGVGGFHLACDAKNLDAIQKLRERKKRPDKPLAVMVADINTCRQIAILDANEERVLDGRERPIVLLRKRIAEEWCEALAPGNPNLGVVLAYSPLHYLLVKPGQVWVMTSGNVSDEPIAIDNHDAWMRLRNIVDGFLFHDRPIHVVCDDSVLRMVDDQVLPIRRSRGFAPLEIPLKGGGAESAEVTILAMGGEMKATICLAIDNHAFLSQHIGDMGNEESLRMLEHVSGHLLELYQAKPKAIAADQHPNYLSVLWAKRFSESMSIPLLQFQHHHAHAASLMAEHELASSSQIIACVFDGTGYGTDGRIWGGEWLIASQHGFTRYAHLRNVPLPGGDACILRPARSALAHLFRYAIPWDASLPCVQTLSHSGSQLLETQLSKGIHCVESSSMGRLFDAISSLIGIRHEIQYEGQAAIELETLAASAFAAETQVLAPYPFQWVKMDCWELHCDLMLRQMIEDIKAGMNSGLIGGKFHETISDATLEVCRKARGDTGLNVVGLTGGVFQNSLLTRLIREKLERDGFHVMTHRLVPPNDAGIALGQAALARSQLSEL